MKLAEICRQRALDTDKEKVRETLMRAALELESSARELAEARELLGACMDHDGDPLPAAVYNQIAAFLARAKDQG